MDMTASSLEGKRIDQNGQVAALIKIVTTEMDFSFEGGTLGIVDSQQRKGEIWVWVPHGLRKITILHQKLGVLRDYRFPLEIEAERTYEMELSTAKVETIVKEEVHQQYLAFKITPANATLEVNDRPWELDGDGTAQEFVNFGSYSYRVQSPDYHADAGVVVVNDPENTVFVSVTLLPNFGWISVSGEGNLKNASVYVDNALIGKAPCKSEALKSGQHNVRIVKKMYEAYSEIVTVSDNNTTTISPVLKADFAEVTLKVDADAEIWVNNEKKGIRSWTGPLGSGTYKIECKMSGHETSVVSKEITTEYAGQTITLPPPIPIYGSILVESTPRFCKLFIDGNEMGSTPKSINEILVGEHSIRLTHEGYADYTESVTIVKGERKKVQAELRINKNEPVASQPILKDGYFVSKNTGSNRNNGSKDAPFKNLQKAIETVPEGATIYVAEGNYFGTLDNGNIPVTKCVKIYGGYSTDFSKRDVLKYRTMVQPNAASNGTASGLGTMIIKVNKPSGEIVIDGLLFDRGNSISYSARGEGKPEGVECPMMSPIGTSGKGGARLDETNVLTAETREIYLENPNCKQITIRNCAFVNAPNYGVAGQFHGKLLIDNNIFINCRMIACDVWGGNSKDNMVVEFCNNTVLFTWTRIKDLGDMGWGFRYNNRTNSYVHHNIIGCSAFAALDRGRMDTPRDREAQKITTAEYNMFFLNRQCDLTLPDEGLYKRVNCEDFEDAEQLTKTNGCVRLDDMNVLKGKINEAYLNGFINVSSTKMFANRYPFEDALKMFGAINGFGAQLPK